jgi:branched-chain amino acid transport system permease protein
MTINLLLNQLITGVALGSVFVLVAVGLSLIFGLLTVVNFAHGAFYMFGAYVGVAVLMAGGNFWVALLVVPLALGTLGLVIERWLVRPLYGRGIEYPILLTFGLAFVMIDVVRMIYGDVGIPFNIPTALVGAVNLGIGYFPRYRLFLVGATALILVVLWLFLERSSLGLIIRAGSRDSEILRVLGVNTGRIWLLVFALGIALAGLAGVLAAPIHSVSPEMGVPVLIEAFVVTVIGGMGSLKGAVIAGLLVGVVSSMTSMIFPAMSHISIFILMALVLLVRPHGLFGRAGLLE